MIVTTDVNPWYKWKVDTILALFLPESCKNRDKKGLEMYKLKQLHSKNNQKPANTTSTKINKLKI